MTVLIQLLAGFLTAAVQGSTVQALDQTTVFTRLSELNSQERFVAPLFGPVSLTDLRPANCSGIRLSNDRSVMVESSGKDYGLELSSAGEARKTAIAVLWIEGTVEIGGMSVAAGPYVAFASEGELRMMTEARTAGGGPSSARSVTIVLTAPLSSAQLDRKAGDRARVTLAVEAGRAFLVVGSSKLPIS